METSTKSIQLPITPNLPGLAGQTEWPDETVLYFIVRQLLIDQQLLRQELPEHIEASELAELHEALRIAASLSSLTPIAIKEEGNFHFPLPGLGAERGIDSHELLIHICCLIDRIVEDIEGMLITRPMSFDMVHYSERALCWAQVLVLVECVMRRAGFETERDHLAPDVLRSRLENQAAEVAGWAAKHAMREEFVALGGLKDEQHQQLVAQQSHGAEGLRHQRLAKQRHTLQALDLQLEELKNLQRKDEEIAAKVAELGTLIEKNRRAK